MTAPAPAHRYVPPLHMYPFDELERMSPKIPIWNFRITKTSLEANHDTITAKVRGLDTPTCPEHWRKCFVKKFSSSHFEFSWEDDPSKCKCFETFEELMAFVKTVTSETKL
jgi:hypothetical protein